MDLTKQSLTPPIGTVMAWLDGVVGSLPERLPFVYHRGYLARDREQTVVGEDGLPKQVVCPEVDGVMKLMWDAHLRGEVVLSQRKLAKLDYLYLAQRSSKWRRKHVDR